MTLCRWSVVVLFQDSAEHWTLRRYIFKRNADRAVRLIEAGRGRWGCACVTGPSWR